MLKRFVLGMALAVSPLMGRLPLPVFAGILNFVPDRIQDQVFLSSGVLVGSIAMASRFLEAERLAAATVRLVFAIAISSLVLSSIVLLSMNAFYLARVSVGGKPEPVVIGAKRQPGCTCSEGSSDGKCISELTLDPDAIRSCWGERAVASRELQFTLTYLWWTASIAAIVSALLIQRTRSKTTVFVSYNKTDRGFARWLKDQLESRGITCWLDEQALKPADRIEGELRRAIYTHDYLFLCCSHSSLASDWVALELAIATRRERDEGRTIVFPLDLDGAIERQDASHLKDRRLQDFRGWTSKKSNRYEQQVADLVQAVREKNR